MRKNDRFEQELNVTGAARRAKAFGIKTMTVVVTAAMLVSGVPTRVIAEGLQEAGVIATQDSTDQSASSSRQLTRRGGVQDQSQATDQSNTQEQPQAASEQAAQPSSQDNASAAQNDSPSAQPAQSAQPSQQAATADIALTLNNASITYKGQVVAQPAQKVTAPTSDSFQFTVQSDNGYKLSKVTLTVSGTDRELKADANGLYTVDAADVAQSPRITLQTEQEKSAEPAKEATPIEDAEGVDGESAAADQSKDEKSDEKDVNAVGVAAPADTKAADYTVEVGGTIAITSTSGGYSDEWTSSDSKTATVSGSGKSSTVTGKETGTVTITHKYKERWIWFESTETFTVRVTPAQPKISGVDTVKMGESTTFTVSSFEQGKTVQWKSENSNVATVDANGNVTGVHVGKTNIIAYTDNQSASKQIEVKRDDSHDGYYVYLYTKAEGNTDGLTLTENEKGWYTIGRVWVEGIENPASADQSGKSQSNDNFNKTIAALQNPDNIDLYGANSINLSDINWRAPGDYGITLAWGANDYPGVMGRQWHLDGYVYFDFFGSLAFHYKDADTGATIAEDYNTTAKVTDEDFNFSSLKVSIDGYTYDHADPASVKVEKNRTKEVILYYKKGTFPYTVRYLEADTNKELHTEKSSAGEYGSTVTESAIDIDGYELADNAQEQQSIQLGTEGNVITFYYKKAPASYTVNYYWNGTTSKVADSKTVETCYVNDEVTEGPIEVAGCTPVSTESKTFKLVKDKSKNEINFYYYKNVELTANSDEATYNGEKHSVSGFIGAPEGANFSEITVGASGTNAGIYLANFAEGTVGKVDKTEKYFVTKATDGKLTIKKRSVTLVSESKGFQYDGKNHSCENVTVDSKSDGFAEGEGVTYKNFATIKDVGIKDNTFDFDWDTAAEGNYEIGKQYGTLSVTKGDISKYVTLNTVDVSETYDGEHHVAGEATATDENGNDLKIEYQKSDGTWTTNRNDVYAVNVDDSGIVNVRVSSPANYGEGNYVTGTEKLVVNPVAITLTAKSDSKPYDGIALTNNGYDVTVGKFVGDEGLDSVTVSGSQTEVGRSDNLITAYALKKNTKADNYDITTATGALEVIPSKKAVVVKIKGNTDTQKYNGSEQSVSGYTVAGVTVDGKDSDLYGAVAGTDFAFSGNATAACTDAGTTDMGLAANQFRNTNGNFSNVTFEVEDGSMTITKRKVTLTSATDEKPYDGTALTNDNVTVSGDGFVSGQGFTANVTGSQTEAGSSENKFTYSLNDGTLEENYQITCEPGTLTVTANDSEVVVAIKGNSEIKTYTGQSQSVEGYKVVNISNDKYTSSDFELKGAAKAERSVEGTTYMGLSANSFVNKSANFSKVTFQVTDGYITIKPKSIVPDPKDPDNKMSVKTPADVVYSGQVQQLKPVVKDGDKTLVEGADYTLSYSEDATNVGTVTVTVTGMGNYTGEAKVSYQITPAPLSITTDSDTKVYDGTPLTARGSIEGLVDGETVDFKTTGSQTEVGESTNTYELTWNGSAEESNYTVEATLGKLEVSRQSIDEKDEKDYKGIKIDNPASTIYDGSKHQWTPTVTDADGNKLTADKDYEVAYKRDGVVSDDFKNAGTITVVISGKGNYSGTVTKKYEITKRAVTLTSADHTWPYDGKDHQEKHVSVTDDGFAAGEGVDYSNFATAKDVTTKPVENTFTYTAKKGTDLEKNYNVKVVNGKLTVTKAAAAGNIVLTTKDESKTYDGHALEAGEAKATATTGDDIKVEYSADHKTWTENRSEVALTNAGNKTVYVRASSEKNFSGFVEATETLTVDTATLTIATKNAEKPYDGKALTADGSMTGLVNGETAEFKVTGTQTDVGEIANAYTLTWNGTAKKSNYIVKETVGTLQVTARSIDDTTYGMSVSKPKNVEYDGNAHKWTPTVKDGDKKLVEGTDYTVAYGEDDFTNVTGEIKVTISGKGNYTGTVERNYQITPAPLTVETEGATKVYDGQELTNKNGAIHGLVSGEHADVVTNGTQTNVGSSDNGYTIAWGTAKEGNYTIASDTLGKLVVTPQSVNPNDPSYHKLQVSNPADLTYDGQTHKWAPEVKDYTGTELKEGVDYALAYDTDDFINAGSITVTVVGKGNYTGTVSRTYRIKPAPVSIKTESAARVYNGKALTAGGAITGLVNGETVDFRVTGSQTKVGHSANTYKLAWTGTAREANYTVDSIETGTLTVTESEDTVVVTTTGGIFTYDGQAHGATVAVSQLPEGYTVDGTPSSDATATDANGDGVKATVDHLVIRNSEGEDVTSKLDIKKVDGTIKVLPAELTVATDSATKVYDGTALTAGATVTGLVGDEEATLEATGKQTQVGSSSNGYKLTFDKTAKDKNYKVVSENLGTLTVIKQSIVPSEPGTPSDNYKGVTVDDPKDAVYDGVEHKWTPVVKDAEGKTLVEDIDYVVSYDTDDFVDVATINVTITGKGNYAGTIAKSYRITKAPLHVVTGSATKVFDGQALTSATVTIDGLAERDRIGIAVTGSQTNVGSSQNTYTIDWMQTSADNYELTDELGTLTVAAAPARPTTPTTPSTPTTPTTPTVPTPTPNNSDGGSTTTTTAPKGDDSSASNDQEQKEEKIIDAKNPLGKFDGKKDTCWVHGYMIICAVATAAYGLFVGLRRDKHSRRLQNDLDKVLGNDDKTQE